MTGEWVYGAIVVLSLLHLLALAYASRNRPGAGENGERPDRDAAAPSEATHRVHDEGVECPACGAVNARGYRFCRRCVADLSGGVSVLEQSTRAESRRTL